MKSCVLPLAGILLSSLFPSAVFAQRGGGGGGGFHGAGGSREGGGSRGGDSGSGRSGRAVFHARRENVGTSVLAHASSAPSRPTAGSYEGVASPKGAFLKPGVSDQRGFFHSQTSSDAHAERQRAFTQSDQGRVYDNGLVLRSAEKIDPSWAHGYFPHDHCHYPYYSHRYDPGLCFFSPFGFYYDECPPYIGSAAASTIAPGTMLVDEPIYVGSQFGGFANASQENYLNDPDFRKSRPGLASALDEVTETFQNANIDALAALVDPKTPIAIYSQARYKYSLPANDFVDLTRDALNAAHSSDFTIQYLHLKATGAFSVDGEQTYRDDSGQIQTIWLSVALQDISGHWTLTQIETAPGQYYPLAK